LTVIKTRLPEAVVPELSVALAVSVWVVLLKDVVSRLKLQLLVPEALEKLPLSTDTWTEEIERLLEAVPDIVIVPDTVAPLAGAEIDTTGGAMTLFTVTVSPALVVLTPALSFAMAFSVCDPLEPFVVSQL
jgi:hypothetical protein